MRTDQLYPRELPDLFKGSQLALVGRYRNDRELRDVTIRLSGNASPRHTYTYPGVRFPLRDERHDFVPRLWATRRVGWLMEQIRSHGENRELVQEVTDLGTRFGIVTPYTSFLALEPGAGRRSAALQGRVSGRIPAPPAPPPPPAMTVTGAGAVGESRLSRARQDALQVESVEGRGPRGHAAGRRTHLLPARHSVGGRGDQRFHPRAHDGGGVRVRGVHALIRRIPVLAQYFAQGEEVDVIHEGRQYRVRARRG